MIRYEEVNGLMNLVRREK